MPTLKNYIRAEFGVVYESIQSYHFLLKFSKLSYKSPDKFDVRRNETAIQQRMTKIREEITTYLADPAWEVFCADETRLMLEAITRKAWLKRGRKTVVKVERTDEFHNYLGMLNLRTYRCETYPIA